MIGTVLFVLFLLAFPALVIWMADRKLAYVDRLGPALLCYAVGLLSGNLGLLPPSAAAVQDAVTSAAIPLGLPLLFFSLDVRGWKRSGPRALLSLGLEAASITVVSAAGFLLFRGLLGGETSKLAGMLIGVYTGGTINLAAIAAALKASAPLYVAANASDIVFSGLYLVFLMTVGKKLIRAILPRSVRTETTAAVDAYEGSTSFRGFLAPGTLGPLAAAFGLALLIGAGGASLTLVLPGSWGTIAAILAVTTLGIAASFSRRVKGVRYTFALGNYLILVFCLAVGSMADISRFASTAPVVAGYMAFAIFGSLVLHVVLAALFRIDADTMMITSVAGICSPPFVPMISASLDNRSVLIPGVITGIIGWVLGTYLGIGVALLLGAA